MNKTTRNLTMFFGAITGLIIIGAVIAAGWMQRSLWAIPLLAGVFTILYIYGKQPAWKKMLRKSPAMIVPSLLMTYASQLLMCGVFYLIGFGAKSVLGETGVRAPLEMFDYTYAGALLAVGIFLGTIVNQFTKRVYADLDVLLNDTRQKIDSVQDTLSGFTGAAETEADLQVTDTPVTPQSIIDGIHYSHGKHVGETRKFDNTPNEKSAGGDAKIAEAEARLGHTFPEGLRAIYRLHNGGPINDVCIPNEGVTGTQLNYDDVLTPFSGYNSLNPMELLNTAWDGFLAFGDPDDKQNYGDLFTPETANMIVLAQWYRETLFLDYNQPGEPRVGFVDFDDTDWAGKVRWWPNFDAFFAQLRHYKNI